MQRIQRRCQEEDEDEEDEDKQDKNKNNNEIRNILIWRNRGRNSRIMKRRKHGTKRKKSKNNKKKRKKKRTKKKEGMKKKGSASAVFDRSPRRKFLSCLRLLFGPDPKQKRCRLWKAKLCQAGFQCMWVFRKIGGFPPKSWILIGFSIINHPFWGTPIFFWKHPCNQ